MIAEYRSTCSFWRIFVPRTRPSIDFLKVGPGQILEKGTKIGLKDGWQVFSSDFEIENRLATAVFCPAKI